MLPIFSGPVVLIKFIQTKVEKNDGIFALSFGKCRWFIFCTIY